MINLAARNSNEKEIAEKLMTIGKRQSWTKSCGVKGPCISFSRAQSVQKESSANIGIIIHNINTQHSRAQWVQKGNVFFINNFTVPCPSLSKNQHISLKSVCFCTENPKQNIGSGFTPPHPPPNAVSGDQ